VRTYHSSIRAPKFAIRLSAGLALLEAWTGIALAFYTDWPASFWITALSAGAYGFTALLPIDGCWRSERRQCGSTLIAHRGGAGGP
jgi:hypothetical protein